MIIIYILLNMVLYNYFIQIIRKSILSEKASILDNIVFSQDYLDKLWQSLKNSLRFKKFQELNS
jgi:hypothetical protein